MTYSFDTSSVTSCRRQGKGGSEWICSHIFIFKGALEGMHLSGQTTIRGLLPVPVVCCKRGWKFRHLRFPHAFFSMGGRGKPARIIENDNLNLRSDCPL